MPKRNQWTGGKVELRIRPLPPELRGATGCLFRDATFDLRVGPEWYLAILEPGTGAAEVAGHRPFQLFRYPGIARTSHGMVLFIIWTGREDSTDGPFWEHFLNPHESKTIDMLSAAGDQSHLKALVIESFTSRVVGWFEFENVFRLDELAASVARLVGDEPAGDFRLAQEEFMRNYSIEDLVRQSCRTPSPASAKEPAGGGWLRRVFRW